MAKKSKKKTTPKKKKSSKKTITDLTESGNDGIVLTGLKNGDTVIFENKKHTFVEYMDYGFSCIIKPLKGEPFWVFATQISKPKK
jgi:hypothetical protein